MISIASAKSQFYSLDCVGACLTLIACVDSKLRSNNKIDLISPKMCGSLSPMVNFTASSAARCTRITVCTSKWCVVSQIIAPRSPPRIVFGKHSSTFFDAITDRIAKWCTSLGLRAIGRVWIEDTIYVPRQFLRDTRYFKWTGLRHPAIRQGTGYNGWYSKNLNVRAVLPF